MAKENFRWINTKFWDDNYIQTLDPSEKLLFLYFLMNPLTNLCGIYEISLRRISFDTGFNNEVINTILKRFQKDNKIVYYKGCVYIVNFLKNQRYKGESIDIAIEKEKNIIPENILAYFSNFDTVPPQSVDRLSGGGGIYKVKVKVKGKVYSSSKMSDSDFDSFWSVYPKRIGKNKAKQFFLKIDHDKLDVILKSIEDQKKTEQWQNPRYIPHPSTWINQGRWEDEIAKPTPEQEEEDYARKCVARLGQEQGMFPFSAKYGDQAILRHKSIFGLC